MPGRRDGGRLMMDWVTIACYDMPYEAQIARARLQAEGIKTFIADEHTINMQWLYAQALGGVKLQVRARDAKWAAEILATDYSADVEEQEGDDSPCCPGCGAGALVPELIGKRRAFLVFLGLDFPLYPTRRALKCPACGRVTPETDFEP